MGKYFKYLLKKIFKRKKTTEQPTKKPTTKTEIKLPEIDISSSTGSGIVGLAISGIVGIIVLIMFAEIMPSLNTSAISSSTSGSAAMSLIGLVPIIIAAVIIMGILAGLTSVMTRY